MTVVINGLVADLGTSRDCSAEVALASASSNTAEDIQTEAAVVPLGRVARKRQQARARILDAAEALMRSRPVAEVTIAEITAAADVGHGSFYLHFQSKYEVLLPILERQAARWDAHMLPRLEARSDPAAVMALALRYVGRRMLEDALWRWFLAHSAVAPADMQRLFQRYCGRDVERGVEQGRFLLPDHALARDAFGSGGYLYVLKTAVGSDEPEAAIDTGAELILRSLGVPVAEAAQLSHSADDALTDLLAETP